MMKTILAVAMLLILTAVKSYSNYFEKLILKTNFENFSLSENTSPMQKHVNQQTESIIILDNSMKYDYSTFTNSMNSNNSSIGAKFLLGALIGAGAGALVCIVSHDKDDDDPATLESDHSGELGGWMLGGALAGGVLFVIDL